jgi:hypothetical protein
MEFLQNLKVEAPPERHVLKIRGMAHRRHIFPKKNQVNE